MLSNESTYSINPHGGHILTEVDGKWLLIDTGAGTTVGKTHVFNFRGESFNCVPSYFGVTTEGLEKLVGHKIDYLVGLEVLRQYPFKIDMSKNEISFYNCSHEFKTDCIVPLSGGTCGALSVPFKFNGRPVSAILDTGAPINYMDKPEGIPDGTADDFFPAFGKWTTKLYRNKIEFGDRKLEMKFGVIPPECFLSKAAPWLVGGGFIKSGPLGFDIRNSRLHLFSNN